MNKKGILIVISGFSGVGKGTVVKKLVEQYGYSLSVSATTRRKFTAQEYCIIALDNSEDTLSVIADFCNLKQSEISRATGLSPVQKSCQTADKQADDVRFWLTASSGPLPPLSTALPETQALSYAAESLRSLLEE